MTTIETASIDTANSELRALIEEDRGEFDRLCQFTPRVSNAIARHPIMRMLVPHEFGGTEAGVLAWFRAGREIALMDGSAAWVAAQNAAANGIIAAASERSFSERMFADPGVNAMTSAQPTVTLRNAGDGHVEINGTWPFGSGCTLASHVGGAVTPESGALPRRPGIPFVMVRADQAEIVPNWNPVGLRGTGSHDVAVRNLVVPRDQVMWFFQSDAGPHWHRYCPIGNSGILVTLSASAVQLGVARTALDIARETLLRRSQMPVVDAPVIDEPTALLTLAEAEGDWVLANGGMESSVAELDRALESGADSLQARLNARLAGLTAIQRCARIATTAYELGGTEASVRGSRLEQCFRDANVLTSHVAGRRRGLAPVMRLILGRAQGWDAFGA